MFASFHSKPSMEQREIQKHQPGLARFRSFFEFVDELIPLQAEDTKQILKLANGGYEPGLTILGFKPRESVPFFHSIHFPLIIYPNDKEVQGSTAAFAQLHNAMLRKGVVAIGEAHHREYWQSRLVAVIPLEKTTSDDVSGRPAGMLVIKLPFEDDIRAIAPDEASKELERSNATRKMSIDVKIAPSDVVKADRPDHIGSTGTGEVSDDAPFFGSIAPDDLVTAAEKMVNKLTVNKRADLVDVPNDAIEDFYTYLKSVALDLPREKIDRGEKINASMLSSKTKAAIDDFLLLLPKDAPSQKKPAAARKRTKDLPPDETGIDWKTLYETDKLSSCKNDQLKACLRSMGKAAE
jgi:Ku70/Ku80 beta-barrel domain